LIEKFILLATVSNYLLKDGAEGKKLAKYNFDEDIASSMLF